MNCPHCKDTSLQMTEPQNIEIDYCPQCRGVWLDRGELDKLIEKSSAQPQPVGQEYRGEHHYDNNSHNSYGHKRQKSWLGEIFD